MNQPLCTELRIPIVDCGHEIAAHSASILAAIEQVGFVYLTNFGIDNEEILSAFAAGDALWSLPSSAKAALARVAPVNSGYVASGSERLDEGGLTELREAFNLTPEEGADMVMPDAALPSFRPSVLSFFASACRVAKGVLGALGAQLCPDHPAFFAEAHSRIADGGDNPTSLRLLRYPPVDDALGSEVTRCGEHTDYGTLTLLFQDDVGGLEVRSSSGAWIPATPIPGAVLLNTGDLMERWTGGRIAAVRHRVLVPPVGQRDRARRSIVLFLHPDHPCTVKPIRIYNVPSIG